MYRGTVLNAAAYLFIAKNEVRTKNTQSLCLQTSTIHGYDHGKCTFFDKYIILPLYLGVLQTKFYTFFGVKKINLMNKRPEIEI